MEVGFDGLGLKMLQQLKSESPALTRQSGDLLHDRAYRDEIVERNYEAASACFSYERAESELLSILRRPQIRKLCGQLEDST